MNWNLALLTKRVVARIEKESMAHGNRMKRAAFTVTLSAILAVMGGFAPLQAQHSWFKQLNRPRNEERALRFGIGIGINTMDFRVTNTGAQNAIGANGEEGAYFVNVDGLHPGFNVNALMRLRFTDNLHLRFLPGISFGQRDLSFYKDVPGEERKTLDVKMRMESAYIEMPILLCYQALRNSNIRPYAVVGVNPRGDMAAFKKLKIEHGQLLRLNKFELAYEVGFGVEFYFTYFKMAPEIKWTAGVLNSLSSSYAEGADAYHAAIKRLTSQMFTFSLIFE